MGQVTDAIRQAIETSDQAPAQIAKGAGVARSQISRLLSGERGLSLETAERLAAYLGLEIVVRPKRAQRRRR